jgi:hypothetical protein
LFPDGGVKTNSNIDQALTSHAQGVDWVVEARLRVEGVVEGRGNCYSKRFELLLEMEQLSNGEKHAKPDLPLGALSLPRDCAFCQERVG